ncbi:MAG TPA: PadR family transcriptional regulator [Epulopiscium sp.]|nr:PadR family transcriptional regulator [Candidatus Epulonipiscium sp.]
MAKQKARSLTQPMYYILLSLKKKRHGYEIMQYVEWLTDGRVKVGPGTLYSLLGRFEEDKYIEMVADCDNKKTYIITSVGDQLVREEMERLELLLKDGSRVIGGHDDEFENRK